MNQHTTETSRDPTPEGVPSQCDARVGGPSLGTPTSLARTTVGTFTRSRLYLPRAVCHTRPRAGTRPLSTKCSFTRDPGRPHPILLSRPGSQGPRVVRDGEPWGPRTDTPAPRVPVGSSRPPGPLPDRSSVREDMTEGTGTVQGRSSGGRFHTCELGPEVVSPVVLPRPTPTGVLPLPRPRRGVAETANGFSLVGAGDADPVHFQGRTGAEGCGRGVSDLQIKGGLNEPSKVDPRGGQGDGRVVRRWEGHTVFPETRVPVEGTSRSQEVPRVAHVPPWPR